MLDAARIQWECSVMEVLPDALTVAWVLAVVAGVALLLSMRTPRLGSRLGWVYPVVMAVASVAVLVVDAAWWLTRSDPRAAAVAGVAGLWLWVAVRERIRVLERRREEFVGGSQARSRPAGPRLNRLVLGICGQRCAASADEHVVWRRRVCAPQPKRPAGSSLKSQFSGGAAQTTVSPAWVFARLARPGRGRPPDGPV